MPNDRKPEDGAQQAAAAIDEATRAVNDAARGAAEASRRTVERQTDAAVEITRAYQDQLADANRRMVAAWSSGAEATWSATLEMQRAWLSTNLALFDASARWNRVLAQQWTETSRQAVLEPLQVFARAAERMAETAGPGRDRPR